MDPDPVTLPEAVGALRAAADASRRPGMARVGIRVEHALGVRVPSIRAIAKRAGMDHDLAIALWSTRIHEARILATLVADPARMTDELMDAWVVDIDSWDVGDFAADLFTRARGRERAIRAWARREEPFVKRCAFAMIARRTVRDRTGSDAAFTRYFATTRSGARDARNEVKKGVSWALRQIGKRDATLYRATLNEASAMLEESERTGSRPMRWVARDVLRELRLPEHVARLGG